ncbi:enoyl-(acyl carrier protein) reductase, partial [Lacticaseibacillus rhamnosus MTCC 5462]
GATGIRVNAISAGAVKTLAVTGIKHHGELLKNPNHGQLIKECYN